MKRPAQNFVIDITIAVAFVLLVSTGFLMKFVLPPGSGRAATVLALDRHQWGDIHFWISVTAVALVAIHLLLHTKWITTMVKGRNPLLHRRRATIGVVAGFVMLFLIALPFLLPVERAATRTGGGEALQEHADHGRSGGDQPARRRGEP